jgi:chromate reductase
MPLTGRAALGVRYIQFKPNVFAEDDDVTNEDTKEFLRNYITDFRDFIQRVLTVLPRDP